MNERRMIDVTSNNAISYYWRAYVINTVLSEDEELEKLLKDKLRKCVGCAGVGICSHCEYEWTCASCKGDGVLCAWCNKTKKYCNCGEN